MRNLYRYQAFGLLLDSQIPIDLFESRESFGNADVTVQYGPLRQLKQTEDLLYEFSRTRCLVEIPRVGFFCIENGNRITVDPEPDAKNGELAVYLLGTCMGAILTQQGKFVLHGSCVTREGEAFLITGDSGAGKSTLAAEFLKNGWKLLTDDVAVINGIEEGKPMVQSSYPSQKLWQDAADRYRPGEALLPLYQKNRRDKYHVRVNDVYLEGQARLTGVVRLIATENECAVETVEGFARVDQLMRNTYRSYLIAEEDRQRHFQRCVWLGNSLRMLVALRSRERDTAHEIYEKILEKIKDKDGIET